MEAPVRGLQLAQPVGEQQLVRGRRRRKDVVAAVLGGLLLGDGVAQVRHDVH